MMCELIYLGSFSSILHWNDISSIIVAQTNSDIYMRRLTPASLAVFFCIKRCTPGLRLTPGMGSKQLQSSKNSAAVLRGETRLAASMPWLKFSVCRQCAYGNKTVHRQDNSPTQFLKIVLRQNRRQFTDTFEDSHQHICFMLN